MASCINRFELYLMKRGAIPSEFQPALFIIGGEHGDLTADRY